VHQAVDAVKTPESNRAMHIDAAMLEGLKDWKKLTQFSGPDDWMFASRSWLDAVGTPLGVLQELMRHADIRTTMNVYGAAAKADMAVASGKIAGLAVSGM
jgi:integrase